MVRPADAGLLKELAGTPLSGLSRSLGIDVEKWLPVASSPLPITLRITPNRHDIEWTRMMIESIGGKRIPWMVMSESWVMPFSKGDYPNEKSKKIITLLAVTWVFGHIAMAHSGRTDKNGGHYNRKTGDYHYHGKK